MNRLPSDFSLTRYGLFVRLVILEDSEFILSLRTSKRGQILNPTDSSLERQIQWMKDYKVRESEGLDYYFIHYYNDEPIGVNRIYNINWEENSCTTGSWLIKEGVNFDISMRTMLILRDIVYDTLNLDISYGDTRKINKHMQRLYKMLDIEQIGETEDEYLYKAVKSKYLAGNEKIKKLIGLL
jgi:hypothetical protein